jgi:hypothetical protein
MNGHEMRKRQGRAAVYAQLLNRDLELSLASIAYTLDVKYNTHGAVF